MVTSKIIVLSLLGLANVYCQTPCSSSHHADLEPKVPEASVVQPKYEQVPAASEFSQELFNREYLPPSDFHLPSANQVQPVYYAPPPSPQPLPKLQPVAQATYAKPVYQPLPKLQPLPQATYVKPVYQPLPKLQPLPQATYVKPVYQPLPKLQPLPQATYVRPVVQPLPKLQPLPSTSQPRYVPQPLPSTPRPVIAQPSLAPSTLKPLPALPRLVSSPAPVYKQLPPLKPISLAPKQIAPLKVSFQSKDNEVQATNIFLKTIQPQATNVQPKIVKPDLETAAQTNRLSYVNPDNIRINHYICEQGNSEQKFLCDILKLWDLQHPKELTSNDLDNPSDNSNNNPTFARLPSPRPTYAPLPSTPRPTYTPVPSTPRPTYAPVPSTPRPTYAPVPSTPRPTYAPVPSTPRPTYAPLPSSPQPVTYAPLPSTSKTVTYAPSPVTYAPTTTVAPTEPDNYFENLPGDSQQNINAIDYLPPYSSSPEPTFSTTTVDIPKKVVAPSNNNINVVTPDDTQTSVTYTSPATITYPTTTTPAPVFTGYEYPKPQPDLSASNLVPAKEGYDYPKPSIPFPVPEKVGYDYPKPAIPFSDGVSYPSFSSIPLSTFNAPLPIYGSALSLDSRFSGDSVNQFPFGFAPLASYSDGLRYQSLSPIVSSTTLSPDLYFKSNSEFVSSPAFSYSYQPLQQAVTTISPLSYSTPSVTYSDQTFSTISPYTLSTPAPPVISYSSQPVAQSISTLAPLLLSKESLALTSSTPAPPTSQFYTTTVSPAENYGHVNTEQPAVTSTVSPPLAASYNSLLSGQYYNSPAPISYNFPSSPVSYNLDNSLSGFNRFNYQPLSGESFTTVSPVEKSEISSEKSTVTTTSATPVAGNPLFFDYIKSQSGYGFPSFGQSFSTISPLSYNSEQSLGVRSNISSFSYQPVSAQSLPSSSPVSYSFQPLGPSFVSGQTYNFPSSFGSGQFLSSGTPSQTPFSYQQSSGSLSGQTYSFPSLQSYQSQSQSSESQVNQVENLSSYPKSALSFGANVQSVENLKDLQATAKALNINLNLGQHEQQSQFAATQSQSKVEEAPRRTSVESKEDISLGNIEILKVKRKSPKNQK